MNRITINKLIKKIDKIKNSRHLKIIGVIIIFIISLYLCINQISKTILNPAIKNLIKDSIETKLKSELDISSDEMKKINNSLSNTDKEEIDKIIEKYQNSEFIIDNITILEQYDKTEDENQLIDDLISSIDKDDYNRLKEIYNSYKK